MFVGDLDINLSPSAQTISITSHFRIAVFEGYDRGGELSLSLPNRPSLPLMLPLIQKHQGFWRFIVIFQHGLLQLERQRKFMIVRELS